MRDFYDKTLTSQEFVETIEILGQGITFKTSENPLDDIHCKLTTNTKMSASSNISQKEYMFNGVMTFPDRISMETLKGSYFTKDNDPNKAFMLVATTETSVSDNFAPVYYVECNKVIDIGYITTEIVDYNEVEIFKPINQNVKCFWSKELREQKDTSIGTLQRSIITIILPSDFPISTKDFVRIKEFSRQTETSTEYVLSDKIYDVESVNNSYINSLDGTTYYGIFVAELSEKV